MYTYVYVYTYSTCILLVCTKVLSYCTFEGTFVLSYLRRYLITRTCNALYTNVVHVHVLYT